MHYNTTKANSPQQKDMRKSLRRNMTPAEAALWRALRGRGAGGWKFRRQQGIRVVRFRNEQVWASVEGIVAEIVRIGWEIQGGTAGVTDPTPSPSP